MAKFNFSLEQYEEKLELVRKYQKYAYGVVVLIVAVQAGLMFIRPAFEEYTEKKQLMTRYDAALKQNQSQMTRKVNIEEELVKLNEELKKKEALFFSGEQLSEFSINGLPKIAVKSGNTVASIRYKPAKSLNKDMKVYPINIKLRGGYRELALFFEELERYNRIIRVSRFSITRFSLDPLILNFDIDIEAYGIAG